jgi:hypothetical protein
MGGHDELERDDHVACGFPMGSSTGVADSSMMSFNVICSAEAASEASSVEDEATPSSGSSSRSGSEASLELRLGRHFFKRRGFY